MAAELTNVEGFEFEVERRGQSDTVNLVISTVRGPRGKRKLLGEAFMRDAFTPVMNYRVKHAKDIDDLRDRFLRQLIKQGYLPVRGRRQVDGRFEDWSGIDTSRFDISGLEAGTAPAETSEA
jgi:hypothetical protein